MTISQDKWHLSNELQFGVVSGNCSDMSCTTDVVAARYVLVLKGRKTLWSRINLSRSLIILIWNWEMLHFMCIRTSVIFSVCEFVCVALCYYSMTPNLNILQVITWRRHIPILTWILSGNMWFRNVPQNYCGPLAF